MSESFLEGDLSRTNGHDRTDGDGRADGARSESGSIRHGEEATAGGVRGAAEDPPFPPGCRAEFTPGAAGEQDEFVETLPGLSEGLTHEIHNRASI
jgi:hypothetical protein